MNKSKKILISLTIFYLLAFTIFTPLTALAQQDITDRMREAIKTVNLPGDETGLDVERRTQIIVGLIINAFLSLFGIIFMILILYGGYKWMMAAGREEELTKAKDIIRSAIIGLIIVMAAYAISYFIAIALETATTT